MTLIKAIPYIGSKARLLPLIGDNIPSNCSTYCETFGGGFSLGLNLISTNILKDKGYTSVIYNDLDTILVDYFKCIKYGVEKLNTDIEFLVPKINDLIMQSDCRDAEKVVKDTRELYLDGFNAEDKSLQCALYYLLKKSNMGMYTEKIYTHISLNTSRLGEVLTNVQCLLNSEDLVVSLENLDFKALLNSGVDKEDTFMYLDPPYLNYSNSKFYAECSNKEGFDHDGLMLKLKDFKGKFILSYGDTLEIREMYKWCNVYEIKVSSKLGYSKSFSNELLISNYPLTLDLDKLENLQGFKCTLDLDDLDKDSDSISAKDVTYEGFDLTFEELFPE